MGCGLKNLSIHVASPALQLVVWVISEVSWERNWIIREKMKSLPGCSVEKQPETDLWAQSSGVGREEVCICASVSQWAFNSNTLTLIILKKTYLHFSASWLRQYCTKLICFLGVFTLYFIVYAITVVPVFLPFFVPLYPAPAQSFRQSPHRSPSPWIMHISSLATLFPMLYFNHQTVL